MSSELRQNMSEQQNIAFAVNGALNTDLQLLYHSNSENW